MFFGISMPVLLSVDGTLGHAINFPVCNVSTDHYCTECEKDFGKNSGLLLRWRKQLLLELAHKAGGYPDSYG